MKRTHGFLFFALVLAGAMALGACDNPVIPPEYTVEFPALPPAWQELMGPAHWRLVWFNPQGISQSKECGAFPETVGSSAIAVLAEVECPPQWATPVLAYPYWPGRGIGPGEMRPAGCIFPFDTAGSTGSTRGTIRLSWQGGVEAWFYRQLSEARSAAIGTIEAAALNKRRPEYFDWPRFRALMDSDVIPEAIREDPWQADWQDIAASTVKSGFDRRRIKAQATEELLVTGVPAGPFRGPSPFAKPLAQEPGVGFHVRVTARSDTYVSAEGILRVSLKTWVYYSF
jgi:hypothetical protein